MKKVYVKVIQHQRWENKDNGRLCTDSNIMTKNKSKIANEKNNVNSAI